MLIIWLVRLNTTGIEGLRVSMKQFKLNYTKIEIIIKHEIRKRQKQVRAPNPAVELTWGHNTNNDIIINTKLHKRLITLQMDNSFRPLVV